jgi:hypothetical protein
LGVGLATPASYPAAVQPKVKCLTVLKKVDPPAAADA